MRTKEDGAALIRKRTRKKMSQRELAALASAFLHVRHPQRRNRCSHETIGQLERGQMRTLSDELAVAIVTALGCDLEDVFEERVAVRAPEMATVVAAGGRPSRRSA